MITCLLAALALAGQPAPDPSGHRSWTRVEAPAAGFSASFPAPPQESVAPVKMGGGSGRIRTYRLDQAGYRWAVIVTEFGSALSQEELDRWPEGAATLMPNVTRKERTTRQGRPAFEVEQRSGGTVALSLIVTSAGRSYQVAVWAKEGPLPADARRFLDGFRIVPVVEPPPAPAQPASAWEEFQPRGAGFAARLPGRPTESPAPDDPTHRIFSIEQEGVRYAVRYMPVPGALEHGPGLAAEIVEEMRDRLVQAGAKATVGKPGRTSGCPSLDLSARLGEATSFTRVVVAADAVYQLNVSAPAGPGQSRFAASFRVLAPCGGDRTGRSGPGVR